MPELPLDDHQRDALVGELDSVGMPQLMRRKAPTDARRFRRSTQLLTRRGGLPAPPGGGAVDDTEQRPTGRVARISRYEVNRDLCRARHKTALQPWLRERAKLPVGPLFCVIVGP